VLKKLTPDGDRAPRQRDIRWIIAYNFWCNACFVFWPCKTVAYE